MQKLLLLVLCCFILSGCGGQQRGIAGVSGSVMINDAPATPGTFVIFNQAENGTDSFITLTDEAGRYQYRPPKGVQLGEGKYIVSVRPRNRKTEASPDGAVRDVIIPGVPSSFGKYSDRKTSDLAIHLTAQQSEQFDIVIKHSQK